MANSEKSRRSIGLRILLIEPLSLKSEFRSPKSERNPKPEELSPSRLRNSDFGFRPSFEASEFGFQIRGKGNDSFARPVSP